MASTHDDLHGIMRRIDSLLEESYALKRTRDSWARHVEIQAEIMRLCRLAADLHSSPEPYWMRDDERRSGGSADLEERRGDGSKAA